MTAATGRKWTRQCTSSDPLHRSGSADAGRRRDPYFHGWSLRPLPRSIGVHCNCGLPRESIGRTVRALFIAFLVASGAPALAARAVASATIVVPVHVWPVQTGVEVCVTTVEVEGYAAVTVAFN